MKKMLKIIGIFMGIIVIIALALIAKNVRDSYKASLSENYYEDFHSDSPLEFQYSQCGNYSVSKLEFKPGNSAIGKIMAWYPTELETNNKSYPMVIVVNGSNTRARNYMPFFKRLASWGFVAVGNNDPQAGTGETASFTLDFILNLPAESVLCNRIDKDRIGIAGYSQGGAGALGAATKYDNSFLYKAVFTGSAAYALLAKNMGWEYDVSKLKAPYFMAAGTGASDDAGAEDISAEFGGVAPLASLVENYDNTPDDLFKVRGRVANAEHWEMQARTDGYMTAWMLYQLQDDAEAGKVFLGNDAEILNNANWQDVEKNG
jgi:hypothetical protein